MAYADTNAFHLLKPRVRALPRCRDTCIAYPQESLIVVCPMPSNKATEKCDHLAVVAQKSENDRPPDYRAKLSFVKYKHLLCDKLGLH
jgi:hypothetical protein